MSDLGDPARAVANVKYFDLLLFLQNSIYDAINMRLMAVQQLS